MSKAQELIKKEGLGGMIITDPYNMRHISGFRGGEGALYISFGWKKNWVKKQL